MEISLLLKSTSLPNSSTTCICNLSILTGPKYSRVFGIKSDVSSKPISFFPYGSEILAKIFDAGKFKEIDAFTKGSGYGRFLQFTVEDHLRNRLNVGDETGFSSIYDILHPIYRLWT